MADSDPITPGQVRYLVTFCVFKLQCVSLLLRISSAISQDL